MKSIFFQLNIALIFNYELLRYFLVRGKIITIYIINLINFTRKNINRIYLTAKSKETREVLITL